MKIILNFNKYILIVFSFILSLFASACHKAGTGGNSSISGTVKHHTKPIPNCVVYIKYGATEFPGKDVSVYDDHMTADTAAHYEFKGLYKGDYYLYGVGYDTAIGQIVNGGIGIRLKKNDIASSDVPVTE